MDGKKLAGALIKAALAVRENSYSPYSKYKVGAAVLFEDGHIYTGTNVENASYGATICAERSAILNAVAGGQRKIQALAVISKQGKNNVLTGPCGECLQVIAEFASPQTPVFLARIDKKDAITVVKKTFKDFYPFSFTNKNLE